MVSTFHVRLFLILAGVIFVVTQPFLVLADNASELATQAMGYERAGEKAKAAEIYEKLIETDPTKRMVLANRLVKLYAEIGNTNKALEWAHVVMERNPDPQAYLAGVHTMLGNYNEAKAILEKEISSVGSPSRKGDKDAGKDPRRKLTLYWQLADVYEKQGNDQKAEYLLKAAVELAKGKPEESAARRRLQKFHEKRTESTEATTKDGS